MGPYQSNLLVNWILNICSKAFLARRRARRNVIRLVSWQDLKRITRIKRAAFSLVENICLLAWKEIFHLNIHARGHCFQIVNQQSRNLWVGNASGLIQIAWVNISVQALDCHPRSQRCNNNWEYGALGIKGSRVIVGKSSSQRLVVCRFEVVECTNVHRDRCGRGIFLVKPI